MRFLLVVVAASLVTIALAGAFAPAAADEGAPPACFAKVHGTSRGDGFRTSKIVASSHMWAAGGTFNAEGDEDVLVAKLDLAGNVLWARAIGTPGADRAEAIWNTTDGGAIVGARTDAFMRPFAPTFWLIKLHGNGSLDWHKVYHFTNQDGFIKSVQSVPAGNGADDYLVAGTATGTNHDGFYALLDANGTMKWGWHVGQPDTPFVDDYDEMWRITPGVRPGTYVGVGWVNTNDRLLPPADRSGLVLKMNETGAVTWGGVLGTPSRFEELYWIKEMNHGSHDHPLIYVTGYAMGGEVGGTSGRNLYVGAVDPATNATRWQHAWAVSQGGGPDEAGFHLHHDRARDVLLLSGASGALENNLGNGLFVKATMEGDLLAAWEYAHRNRTTWEGFRVVEPTHEEPTLDASYVLTGWTGAAGAGGLDALAVGFRPDDQAPAMDPEQDLVARHVTMWDSIPGLQLTPLQDDEIRFSRLTPPLTSSPAVRFEDPGLASADLDACD